MRIGLFLLLLCGSLYAKDVKTYIPPQAYQYFDDIRENINLIIPSWNRYYRSYFPALIEHESCISLTHSRCWNPRSRLKTKREEGAGLGQLTRAYRSDGTLRFDSLTELKRRHMEYLKELTWDNIYQRADLQIRAIVLMTKDNYLQLSMIEDVFQRIAMTDAAYNGGLSGVHKERRACGLAKDCNPDIWFDNVERYCLKSKKILYGNRNACDINRYHVKDVLLIRRPKYSRYFDAIDYEWIWKYPEYVISYLY